MKNNFKKNDKLLFHAHVVADVLAIILAVVMLIYGIYILVIGSQLDITSAITVGIILIVAAPIITFAYWVFVKVMLNMYCDVKLIRNKLYDKSNDYLSGLTESNSGVSNSGVSNDIFDYKTTDSANTDTPIFKNTTKLKELKSLLDSGILTQEEFDAEKKKILFGNTDSKTEEE